MEGGTTGIGCVRLPQCWLKSRETAIDSNSETQGFGMCFCFHQTMCAGQKP